MEYKEVILGHLLDYLDLKKWDYAKRGKVIMVKCTKCRKEPHTANVIPNTDLIYCFECKKDYDLIDIVKQLEPEYTNADEEKIIVYLKGLLKVKEQSPEEKKVEANEIDKLLDFYVENEWSLLAICANGKVPIKEMKEWEKNNYRDKIEWKRWLSLRLNLAVKTGKNSNITALDIDVLTKPEKIELRSGKANENRIKELMQERKRLLEIVYKELGDIGNPLIQETLGGQHLIYQHDEELPKTHFEIKGMIIDLENEGGYILIYPSILSNHVSNRRFQKLKEISKMPEALKKLILSKVTVPRKTDSEEIRQDIKNEDFKINPKDFLLKENGLEGTCNNSFIRLGGILRKELNVQETRFVLHTFNQHMLEHPMKRRSIDSMVNSLDKYIEFDEAELAHKILEYLRDSETARKDEIEIRIFGERVKGENKGRLDKTLRHLIKEDKIIKRRNEYEIINKMEWDGNILDVGVPITEFIVPYFHDHVQFNWEDLVIIGSQNKYGKTTLAMNMIARIVKQGIKPYYIYNESGSRYAKTALRLGLKNDDFMKVRCSDSEKIILEKHSVVIYDWVKPNDFARTDNLFNSFVDKLEKTKSFMICFVQLRNNDGFFAPDQIGQFPSLLCKYLRQEPEDRINTHFKFIGVRETKNHIYDIPCKYEDEGRTVKTVEEIELEKKKATPEVKEESKTEKKPEKKDKKKGKKK